MKSNKAEGLTLDMVKALLEPKNGDSLNPEDIVCRGYCEYYRGGEADESCGGRAAVGRGFVTGKIGPTELTYLLDVPPVAARRSGCLINELCSRCGYLEEGCDFMSPSPPADATPCGGYRLLQALLDHGALTPAVVRGLVQST